MRVRLWCVVVLALSLVSCAAVPAWAQSEHGSKRGRPAALVPLYLAFAGLQALDVHSTINAVGNGGRETNPVVRGALSSPGSMLALKAGAAVGVVFVSEKIWPHNRAAAVITMVALNSAYVTIAANNYRTVMRR